MKDYPKKAHKDVPNVYNFLLTADRLKMIGEELIAVVDTDEDCGMDLEEWLAFMD